MSVGKINNIYGESSGGGSRVIYLGTGTSFNLSQILPDDYQNLTADNFIVGAANLNGASTSAATWGDHYNVGAKTGTTSPIGKTYDATTGTLTLTNTTYSVSTYGHPANRYATGTFTCFAYVVLGEIET
jgi:hypothetical protein